MKVVRNSRARKIAVSTVAVFFGIVAVLVAQNRSTTGAAAGANANPEAAKYRALLDQYCVGCHNDRTAMPSESPVNLQGSFDDLLNDAETWERVLRKLSVRAMPPPGMPRPPEAEYAGLTNWLATSLDRAWEGRSTPGRYVVHRLNRAEYANAVRDLLAVEIDVSDLLPSDGADYGFDNIATALKTSPLLLEGYVNAAQRVSAMAVGDPGVSPGITEHSIPREFSQNGYIEGLPLGTSGGTVVRHVFPADAEYNLSGRLIRGIAEGYSGVEGNDIPYTFLITVDGAEVFSTQIGGPTDHQIQGGDVNVSRAEIERRMTGRARITAGPHDVGFTWKERPFVVQDVWEPSQRDSQEIHFTGGNPKLRTVAIDGPYNVFGLSEGPSRDRLYVCHPASVNGSKNGAGNASGNQASGNQDDVNCANDILASLARRAYRRPVTSEDVEAPMSFYRQSRADGGSFDDGIRAGVARVLSSPYFLFRIEEDPANTPSGVAHPVSDIELASRLSFFLWSSVPDETLLGLAEAKQLRQPATLAAQVQRMLEDERADALIENFTGQWLQLRNLEAKVAPDLLMFPDFDANIRSGFRKETELFFGYILRENRSVLELLSADYTFLDERLAKHYGIEGVYGPQYRRVKLTDSNRHGLLGQGSILAMTSAATRTSPVFRGKYVLSTFLNTPPPPPPPNVPALEDSAEKGEGAAPKTVRALLEVHRANPVCASCHSVIDPVGFALENFDSVGSWRDTGPDGAPLDVAGTLVDGTQVNGPVPLREAILSRPDAFTTIVAERMLTYALGRGLEPGDMPVVRSIVKQAAESDYQLAAIVMGIVESAPFQMRTKLETAEGASQADIAGVTQPNNTARLNALNNEE